MLVSIVGVAMPPKGNKREVKRFVWSHAESNEDNRHDGVYDANHALLIVQKLTKDSTAYIQGEAPVNKDHQWLWLVSIQVSNTHRDHASYKVDYHKFPGCPLVCIEDMMQIYGGFRKLIRESVKDRRDRMKQKKENRHVDNS